MIGLVIEKVAYDVESQQWIFNMTNGATLCLYCPWQVISNARVSLASGDHGQQYGLSSPIDAAVNALGLLGGRRIESIIPDELSADLLVRLEGDILLRTFNDSSGCEAWQLNGNMGMSIIGQGGGNIVVFDNKA
jgi:hypothetical protein